MSDLLIFYSQIEITNNCWNWTGKLDSDGYGLSQDLKNIIGFKTNRAHRVAYYIAVKDLISGLTIDHLCRNRRCVNPAHLEEVTNVENVLRGENFTAINARKTHCYNGHPFNEANTYNPPNAKARICRICQTNNNRKWYLANKVYKSEQRMIRKGAYNG